MSIYFILSLNCFVESSYVPINQITSVSKRFNSNVIARRYARFSCLASRRGTCISVPTHFFSDGGAYIIKRIYRCKPVGNVSIHPTKYRNEIVVQTNSSNSFIKTKTRIHHQHHIWERNYRDCGAKVLHFCELCKYFEEKMI